MKAVLIQFGRPVLMASALSLGLSGCMYDRYLNQSQSAKPVVVNTASPKTDNTLRTASLPMESGYYKKLSYTHVTVRRGDSMSLIAGRHGIPVEAVLSLNSSISPNRIYPGQQIKVPVFRQHKVKSGETLYAISRLYDVEVNEVLHFNQIASLNSLQPGTALRIPSDIDQGTTRVASIGNSGWVVPKAQEEPKISSTPQGKTDWASKAGVAKSELAAPPVVAPAPAPKPIVRAVEPPAPSPKETVVASLPKETPIVLGGDAIPTAELPPLPRNKYSIKHPPARAGKIFGWPAQGPLLSSFGKKDSGLQNDGINIKLNPGTPIHAAENGIVSYVGNEMRSFGNLVLISHADGYVTTYGHLGEAWVKKGDQVLKGDVIGVAGATGDVDRAQLHFEIRKNGRAKNPTLHLAQR
ncbi:peptidoglycan DD-metalloendopeptidase family protein [Sneathiella sp. P13V-1]|uniref:LysM peptidoglycan-binding domain-containing M23 family metallopeptidase n=1 Tax=Sneathiella sp. P13V-1 TaxID=2697366 RepID=UPI00187B7C3B|nr:LysM peptidoglycan-binding domain-containing M23 family metallopeptidase [Sneathiella sp. P13V-1]MBE7637675.1 peptidoglycan DD-metalloendopeptidase family protein [Sneathiella sp. P13V-1]